MSAFVGRSFKPTSKCYFCQSLLGRWRWSLIRQPKKGKTNQFHSIQAVDPSPELPLQNPSSRSKSHPRCHPPSSSHCKHKESTSDPDSFRPLQVSRKQLPRQPPLGYWLSLHRIARGLEVIRGFRRIQRRVSWLGWFCCCRVCRVRLVWWWWCWRRRIRYQLLLGEWICQRERGGLWMK